MLCLSYNVVLLTFHFWAVSSQWTVTGVHGSRGGNAPRPVEVEREHASVSVTARLLATAAACVRVTPPSFPSVARRPARVRHAFTNTAYVCVWFINTSWYRVSLCQAGPRQPEGASSGTSTILSLASPSSTPPSQTAGLVADSSRPLFLTSQGL